jgi:hypothetical protein
MSSSFGGFLSPLLMYYIILTIFSWFEAHTACIFLILLALNNLSNKSGITMVDKKTYKCGCFQTIFVQRLEPRPDGYRRGAEIAVSSAPVQVSQVR